MYPQISLVWRAEIPPMGSSKDPLWILLPLRGQLRNSRRDKSILGITFSVIIQLSLLCKSQVKLWPLTNNLPQIFQHQRLLREPLFWIIFSTKIKDNMFSLFQICPCSSVTGNLGHSQNADLRLLVLPRKWELHLSGYSSFLPVPLKQQSHVSEDHVPRFFYFLLSLILHWKLACKELP